MFVHEIWTSPSPCPILLVIALVRARARTRARTRMRTRMRTLRMSHFRAAQRFGARDSTKGAMMAERAKLGGMGVSAGEVHLEGCLPSVRGSERLWWKRTLPVRLRQGQPDSRCLLVIRIRARSVYALPALTRAAVATAATERIWPILARCRCAGLRGSSSKRSPLWLVVVPRRA